MIGVVALGVTLIWACSSVVEDLVLTPDASAEGDSTVGGGSKDRGSKSGARLQVRPIVYEGDDGSIIHMGEEFFDTKLRVTCQPQRTTAGDTRCVPMQKHVFAAYFADPSCTSRVAWADGLCVGTIGYHVDELVRGCSEDHTEFQVWRVEEVYSGPVYQSVDGECTSSNLSGSNSTLARVVEIPASELVLLQK